MPRSGEPAARDGRVNAAVQYPPSIFEQLAVTLASCAPCRETVSELQIGPRDADRKGEVDGAGVAVFWFRFTGEQVVRRPYQAHRGNPDLVAISALPTLDRLPGQDCACVQWFAGPLGRYELIRSTTVGRTSRIAEGPRSGVLLARRVLDGNRSEKGVEVEL